MNLLRYTRTPGLLDTINKEINELLAENGGLENHAAWKPRVDIQSKNDCYMVYADLPGVDPKDINVAIDGNLLTIEGSRNTQSKEEKEGFSRVERFSGNFYRQFSLPENVAGDDIVAHCAHGVLQLTIPKRQKQNIKRIEVKAMELN